MASAERVESLCQQTATLQRRSNRKHVLTAVIIVAGAAFLRFAASFDGFWLDEIWSWQFASQVNSPIELLTKVKHDNNHFLNTWVIFSLGRDVHWFWYRVPAVLAGVGTVVLAGAFSWRRDRLEAISAMTLCGSSFLLVQYSSEARGYAYVTFFSLLAVWLAGRCCEQRDKLRDFTFALTAVFGFLSHLTFVFCYAGIACWMCWRLFVQRSVNSDRWGTIIRCHALPVGCFAWIYAINVREMTIGGGAITPLTTVATRALSLTLGGPELGPLAIFVAWLAIAGMFDGLALLWHRRSHLAILFGVTCVFAPALVLIVTKPVVLYERYFLVPSLFLLLLIAHLLVRSYRVGPRWSKVLSAICFAAIVVGNAYATNDLIRTGRGDYHGAIEFIARNSTSNSVSISSDYDFRNETIIDYYDRRRSSTRKLFYVPESQTPGAGTHWLIHHSQDRNYQPASTAIDRNGNLYELLRVYRYTGLSGWHWAIFRRMETNAEQVSHLHGKIPFVLR